MSEGKQEKKGLAVQANDISASASRPGPRKTQPLLLEALRSNTQRQKRFGFLAGLQNTLDVVLQGAWIGMSQVGDADM